MQGVLILQFLAVPACCIGSMVLSTYEKQRIVSYHHNKLLPSQIISALKVEGIFTTRLTISRFIARYEHSGSISISLSTILRSRSMLGWIFGGSKYCQQIWNQNKDKCFLWVADNYSEFLDKGFENVIWSNETTV